MTSHAGTRNGGMLVTRGELSMPKWVTEQTDRIGPKPPPPPVTSENMPAATKPMVLPPKTKQPEPDYEVIEFSNQQYSNTPLRPNSASSGSKTPDNKLKCALCGSGNPWVNCDECSQQLFCASCDDMFHKHPKRKGHQRKTIDKSRPPLPPKVLPGQAGPTPPVAPPRRNKRGLMTPLMQRKDQGNTVPGPFPESTSPTPSSKSSSLRDRIGSLPRGLNLFNRPLPETPKTPSESSRSTTPKSVFDNIQRPPSVALEKIKSKANATLDRMQILQQRYRQQKEQMERERSGTATDQNMSAFDQWSSISQSPSHFRSGSMSSGINSSHLDLVDDNNFNLFHQHQMALQHHHLTAQRANQLGQRGMSSSVFNLSQMNGKQAASNNGWMHHSVQQAQSMAQLNCGNCGQQQQMPWNGRNHQQMHKTADPWSNQLVSQQHLNRSNMSLNAGFMMQPQMSSMYPPPAFMNQRNFMPPVYPQPYMGGMPVMNPGLMCMPPSTSRVASRAGSRLASPAMSRKSVTLRRKQRSSYIDDEATDDEDSDEDDRRSITSIRSGITRPRQRRISSASQFQMDDDMESTQAKLHRNRLRNQRRDSVAKSVNNDWAPGRKASSANRSADSGFNSPLKPSRIYSDLDSEGSGTRALVQAKIEQKLKEETLKQKPSKTKTRPSKSPPPQKTSAAVQTPAIKQTQKGAQMEVHNQETQETVTNVKESEIPKEITNKNLSNTAEDLETKAASTEAEDEATSETQSQSQSEESDVEQETDEVGNSVFNEIQDDELGPPPSTPDHEWECEFCTFVNEANIKICSICCKTPSVQPKQTSQTSTPLKQPNTPLTLKENECAKRLKKKSEKSGTIKKSPLTSATSTQPTTVNGDLSPKAGNHTARNTNCGTESTAAETFKNKETVQDVWAAADETFQATANEARFNELTKKSAKETLSPKAAVDLGQTQNQQNAVSSPPQVASTQTYDTLPAQKAQTRSASVTKQTSQPLFDDVIQQTNFPLNPQKADLQSFEAQVLNNIHNISHTSSHLHQHQLNHPLHFYNERQRYRSSNDLRLDDADFEGFDGLKKGQLPLNELLLLQKTSSQAASPYGGSIYDLPYHELSSIKSKDMENHKESDLYKHTTEELNAAIKYCGPDTHPLVWLRDNWPKLIQTVQSLATKYGQERAENTIGTISQMEAREALRMHTGNIWQAVSECIEQRQRKYREISAKGNFSREDIVTALTTHQGNVESALFDLGHTQLKPFLMRIWGSPGGVENECAFQPLPDAASPLNMDKDIHNFLRVNASECMQTPNSAGANLVNNQTPSPYDRPDSFNSPFESINYTFDNASSYSPDSKTRAHSPLPLDESIINNKNILEDLEILIGNMEQTQQKLDQNLFRSIHDKITHKTTKSENDYDPDTMRILTKSPIVSSKLKTASKDGNPENGNDIKSFVWQHIQEIMPNLVQQVELELVEGNKLAGKGHEEGKEVKTITATAPGPPAPPPPPPPIDQDVFLMEEVIKPNIKNASIREELPQQFVYATEIASFKLAFDKALAFEHAAEFEFEELADAPTKIYQMFEGPKARNLPGLSQSIEMALAPEAELPGAEVTKSFTVETENIQTSQVLSKTEDLSTAKEQSEIEKRSTASNSNFMATNDRSQIEKPSTTNSNFMAGKDRSKLEMSSTSNSNPEETENQTKTKRGTVPTENHVNQTVFESPAAAVESSIPVLTENNFNEILPLPPIKSTKDYETGTGDAASTNTIHLPSGKGQTQNLEPSAELIEQHDESSLNSVANTSDSLASTFQLEQSNGIPAAELLEHHDESSLNSVVNTSRSSAPTLHLGNPNRIPVTELLEQHDESNSSSVANTSHTLASTFLLEQPNGIPAAELLKQLDESSSSSVANTSRSLSSTFQLVQPHENFIHASSSIANLDNKSNLSKSCASSQKQLPQSERDAGNESSPAVNLNRRFSKIPVRRTASNKSLANIASPKQATKTDFNEVIEKKDANLDSRVEEHKELVLVQNLEKRNSLRSDDLSENEDLHKIASKKSTTELAARLCNVI